MTKIKDVLLPFEPNNSIEEQVNGKIKRVKVFRILYVCILIVCYLTVFTPSL